MLANTHSLPRSDGNRARHHSQALRPTIADSATDPAPHHRTELYRRCTGPVGPPVPLSWRHVQLYLDATIGEPAARLGVVGDRPLGATALDDDPRYRNAVGEQRILDCLGARARQVRRQRIEVRGLALTGGELLGLAVVGVT